MKWKEKEKCMCPSLTSTGTRIAHARNIKKQNVHLFSLNGAWPCFPHILGNWTTHHNPLEYNNHIWPFNSCTQIPWCRRYIWLHVVHSFFQYLTLFTHTYNTSHDFCFFPIKLHLFGLLKDTNIRGFQKLKIFYTAFNACTIGLYLCQA